MFIANKLENSIIKNTWRKLKDTYNKYTTVNFKKCIIQSLI